jgi:hypothetical protein
MLSPPCAPRTAFRVLAKIGLLEVVKTETFPAEEVEVFVKAFV